MLIKHLASSRGLANHGWLQSFHTFSFGDYYNPQRMGFGALRVINDDKVSAGMGFNRHPHRDMEIISIPLHGVLRHHDSMGHTSEIRPGEIQLLSAGTGIFHSEMNGSQKEEVQFLQIWVLPEKLGIQPRYQQRQFERSFAKNSWQLLVSPNGVENSLFINQEAWFSLAYLSDGTLCYQRKRDSSGIYVFLVEGKVQINKEVFSKRDGGGFLHTPILDFQAHYPSTILVMEVPFN
jgi:redox-sensitive bicupin YhaK (pirin superfamily)